MLQRHHHRLLDKISLDKSTKVISVDGKIRQLESAERSVQKRLVDATRTGYVRTGQRDDGGAGV